jgi:hypothetical protein
MTILVDCIEAASFTTYLNNKFGIKIAPYSKIFKQVHDKRN